MSRIKGIEVKVQKEVLQTRKYGLNEILKKNSEDHSSDSKDDVEKNQISDLLQKLPKLDKAFEVHRKIGEGTFSSVYLGSLRREAREPAARRRWFAIKHLVPTAHPARVEHELRCLQDMGGKHHVIGVDLCLRHLDTIVFIMPYIPHKKFSEYVGAMDGAEARGYMRALLSALAHVHSFGVIHRDVKPSNFLYDRDNRRYQLVDFGLAQRLCPPPPAAPAPPPAHTNLPTKRAADQLDEDESAPDAKRAALDLSVANRTRAHAAPSPAAPATPAPEDVVVVGSAAGGARGARCACAGRGGVCGACAARPAARAPRAGTQGYRPPEVLLKVGQQGTGVDTWAAGVVLCSVLCARHPLLRGAGDEAALAELAALLGSRALRRAAARARRRLVCSAPRAPACLRALAASARSLPAPPPCRAPLACLCRGAPPPALSPTPALAPPPVAGFPDSAFCLATRLLQPDPADRLSAAAALEHPFLRDD